MCDDTRLVVVVCSDAVKWFGAVIVRDCEVIVCDCEVEGCDVV